MATLTSQLSANVSPCGAPCSVHAGHGVGAGCAHGSPDLPFSLSHATPGSECSPIHGFSPNMRAHLFLHFSQANLVAAFEQSLVSMTSRLRHLAETAEEKVGVSRCSVGLGGCWT